jgi:anthranilate synthase component 1
MAPPGIILRMAEVTAATLRRLLQSDPVRYPMLFDSVARGAHARWSILAAAPRYALTLNADRCLARSDEGPVGESGFLAALEHCWQSERLPGFRCPQGLPFAGGWCVFLGYEVASEIEPRLRLPRCPDPWRAFALRIPVAVLHDAESGETTIVAEPGEEAQVRAVALELEAAQRAEALATPPARLLVPIVEEPGEWFLAQVERLREAIRAGEIYQANLARTWRAQTPPAFDAVLLYERLCRTNPAPFAAYAAWRGMRVLSSSPERLLRIAGGRISTRPIAGTRPRRHGDADDAAEIATLRAHPKERAEHVMLIDLERNDLGRVCEAGSIAVDEFMAVESYAHVHHLVSNVSGRLRRGISPVAALRAMFPGGTITGCPKFRCMQLIAREEGVGRGAYTGSLGYIGHDGSADFSILIRSITLAAGGARCQAGAGIVADSDPLRELEETRAKARGVLAALEADA